MSDFIWDKSSELEVIEQHFTETNESLDNLEEMLTETRARIRVMDQQVRDIERTVLEILERMVNG